VRLFTCLLIDALLRGLLALVEQLNSPLAVGGVIHAAMESVLLHRTDLLVTIGRVRASSEVLARIRHLVLISSSSRISRQSGSSVDQRNIREVRASTEDLALIRLLCLLSGSSRGMHSTNAHNPWSHMIELL
jgi:hypothetical protein